MKADPSPLSPPERCGLRNPALTSRIVGLCLAAIGLSGCETLSPSKLVDDLKAEHAKVEQALREKAQLETDFAETRIKLVQTEYDADMVRVQQMADANYEAQLANRRNPQQNNSTYIVETATSIVAANSPVPVSPGVMTEAAHRVELAEQAETTTEIDSYYKGKWEEAQQALAAAQAAREESAKIRAEQEKLLREKEGEIERRYRGGMEAAENTAQQLANQLNAMTQKLYKELVWIFAGAGVIAGGLAFWCFYTGNFRMGTYAIAGAGFFGAAAFLTVFLQENQWVVWVFGAVGLCALAAILIVKQGWLARNNQLVSFAGKRETLVRFIENDLGKKLQDFGLADGETLLSLDLHEVEQLQEKVVALLKAERRPVPDFLKDG